MSKPQDPTVTITFKLSELNYTLQALATRPFVEVNELIKNLQEQGQQALAPPGAPAPEAPVAN